METEGEESGLLAEVVRGRGLRGGHRDTGVEGVAALGDTLD